MEMDTETGARIVGCSYCHKEGRLHYEIDEFYDQHGIYAGKWHPECWEKHGYGNWRFDPDYAGERLDEDG